MFSVLESIFVFTSGYIKYRGDIKTKYNLNYADNQNSGESNVLLMPLAETIKEFVSFILKV